MTPVPPPSTRGAKLKYAYDKVKADKPLPITLKGATPAEAEAALKSVRANVSSYGHRHGVLLVTRLKSRSEDGLTIKLEVHYAGRRK